MKKVLKKRIKNSSNAVRYFSSELVNSITYVDGTCYIVDSVESCPC